MNKGKLYLIPTILGEGTEDEILSTSITNAIKKIKIFIVENIRTARRHIRKIDKKKDIESILFYSYGKHDTLDLEQNVLSHILSGKDIGILSEAGAPCIADPGSKIVAYAHDFQINVVPLSGPSSISLALMSSGLNGQNFAFVGYLPINKHERRNKLKALERLTQKKGQTQIFIEAPYRNNQLFNTIISTCNKNTKLCVCSEITLPNENIKTKSIEEWKTMKINIHKKPTVFLIGQ